MSIDKLFEKKLADHSIAPSQAAWENLETQLAKKNNPLLWLRWAAVFLLGGLLLSILLLQREDVKLPIASQPLPIPTAVESKSVQTLAKKENSLATPKRKRIIPAPSPAQQPVIRVESDNPEITKESPPIAEVKTPQPFENFQSAQSSRSIVLVYTLDPVGQTTTEHATEEMVAADQRDNSFKKMIKIASEVKNSESPLGGIRDMKEELFALDLRKKSTTKKH